MSLWVPQGCSGKRRCTGYTEILEVLRKKAASGGVPHGHEPARPILNSGGDWCLGWRTGAAPPTLAGEEL